MLLVMYSLKETALNIHIKTRNTLKKVLHWTVFLFCFCFLFTLVTRPLPVRIYIVQKHTCGQLTYFRHFDGSRSNKKPAHSITFIKLEILSESQVWYLVQRHLPSQGFTLHTARHTAFTHRATIDWLKSHHVSLSNTIIKLDSNCLNVKTIKWL